MTALPSTRLGLRAALLRHAALVLLALVLGVASVVVGCNESTSVTAIVLTVRYESVWALSSLEVRAEDKTRRLAARSETRVLVPDSLGGQRIRIDLVGLRGEIRYATGFVNVDIVRGEEVRAEVTLARVACGAWCTPGATACRGDGTVICEQRDEDGCFEWSDVTACPAEANKCSFGLCASICLDECELGERRCAGPSAVELCGEGDSDSCTEWVEETSCVSGQTCAQARCQDECVSECEAGTTECFGAGTRACGDLNRDGCTEWGPTNPCTRGQTCSEGQCRTGCADECEVGATRCTATLFQRCGNYDPDTCREWSHGTECAEPATSCDEGMCTATGCASAPKVCEEPPASTCLNATTLRTYAIIGACTAGECAYAPTDTACEDACVAGACSASIDAGSASDAGADAGVPIDAPMDAGTDSGFDAGRDAGTDAGLNPFPTVTAGGSHSCGLRRDGTVFCWGSNTRGQAIPPLDLFLSVSAGGEHTCGVRADHTLACWGSDAMDQSSPPSGRFSSVSAGTYHTCAVREDGPVICWGRNDYGESTSQTGSFRSVSASRDHSCGIRTDGSLLCWGSNAFGQTTAPPGTFVSVGAGSYHTCGVLMGGSVDCWGDGSGTSAPADLFASVTANYRFSCGVRADGALDCWGLNDRGQSNPPTGTFLSVSAGAQHSCGVRSDDRIVCWGDNTYGQRVPPT